MPHYCKFSFGSLFFSRYYPYFPFAVASCWCCYSKTSVSCVFSCFPIPFQNFTPIFIFIIIFFILFFAVGYRSRPKFTKTRFLSRRMLLSGTKLDFSLLPIQTLWVTFLPFGIDQHSFCFLCVRPQVYFGSSWHRLPGRHRCCYIFESAPHHVLVRRGTTVLRLRGDVHMH